MRPLTRFEIVAAAASFLLIFACGIAKGIAVRAGVAEKTADIAAKCGIVLFFFIFGISCMGLMIHVFIGMQAKIGNASEPMIRFLADHELGVTLFFWGFLGLGLLIALPFLLADMGLEMPLPKSKGTLVADIGMSLDEVKQRSTLQMKEPRYMGDGSWLGVADVVFEYRIGDSAVRFPQSRYYWITTPKNDRRINALNIGITPRKMPKPELEAFQTRLQKELLDDGWMPGHHIAKTEETVRLWGGSRTAGDGRYWLKGNTLLIFEVNRMDEAQRDEPPGTGEFILYLDLRPKSNEPELVYERSAWPGR